ncbi:MAG: helix-turn-helix domain-containing protein [Candidatus Woesearchaeota archaeon]
MKCEMCSSDGQLTPRIIEGVELQLCPKCKHYGLPPAQKKQPFRKKSPASRYQQDETYEFITPKAGQLIKAEREKRNLKQIDLSRMLNIKESVIHQVESGHAKPTFADAKIFEQGLGVKLIFKKDTSDIDIQTKPTESSGFTIADMIKKKKE